MHIKIILISKIKHFQVVTVTCTLKKSWQTCFPLDFLNSSPSIKLKELLLLSFSPSLLFSCFPSRCLGPAQTMSLVSGQHLPKYLTEKNTFLCCKGKVPLTLICSLFTSSGSFLTVTTSPPAESQIWDHVCTHDELKISEDISDWINTWHFYSHSYLFNNFRLKK